MHTVLGELADIDRRLDDAIVQLREQQAMVAIIDCDRADQAVLLSLLSSVLEQFFSLQSHRKAVLKRDSSTLPDAPGFHQDLKGLNLVAGEGFEPPTSGL
jgi:hypothetical protein